jgi:hypothetical protein
VLPDHRSKFRIVYVLNPLQLILRLEAGLTHLPEGERPFVSELVSPLGQAGWICDLATVRGGQLAQSPCCPIFEFEVLRTRQDETSIVGVASKESRIGAG